MGKRKTLLVDEIMAFRDWLRNQQEQSEKRKRLFEGRTSLVPASQAWGGYQDRPGGQRLMTRQMTPPPASVTLTEKNDGTRTKVTKWEPEKSQVKVSGLPDEGVMSRGRPVPPPRNQRNPFRMPLASLPRGRLSPEAQSAIAQVQATGGQNVDAYGNRLGPDLQSYRAMQNVTTRPNLQTIQPQTPSPIDAIRTRQNIGRFAPVVGTSPYGHDIRGGAARVPSGQEEGLFRDPVGQPSGANRWNAGVQRAVGSIPPNIAGHIDRFLTKYPSLESAAQDGVENIWKRIRDRMSRGNY